MSDNSIADSNERFLTFDADHGHEEQVEQVSSDPVEQVSSDPVEQVSSEPVITAPSVPETPKIVPTVIEAPVAPKQQKSSFVPLPEAERSAPISDLDDKSKLRVIFWYPQSEKPEISIDGGPFIPLPAKSHKQTIAVQIKADNIFPLTCVFKNEHRTFRKQVFEYYGSIDPTQVSIQRSK